MRRTIREPLQHSVVVRADPDTGECRLVRRDPMATRVPDPTPPCHCTVTAFPDAAGLAARVELARAARDNAVTYETSLPDGPGFHLLLAVHHDRPVEPGTAYRDAVAYEYAGRGRLSGPIEGGPEAWTEFLTVFDRTPMHVHHRPHPDGHEIAWHPGDLGLWLDPDLEERLGAAVALHGLRLVGGGMVARAFPGSLVEAQRAAAVVERAFEREVEAIGEEADARTVARILVADPAVPRMLRKLSEGCLVLWSPNYGNASTSSYQLRRGGGPPTKVSGERIWDLARLGAVKAFWEPAPGAGFHGLPWHLVAITDAGRALAEGDIVAGVARRPWSRELPSPTKRVVPKPFLPAVEAFAAGLTEADREALVSDIAFPKSVTVEAAIRSTGKVEAFAVILAGLISGHAVLTPEGRFKAVPEPKPAGKVGRRRGTLAGQAADEVPADAAMRPR